MKMTFKIRKYNNTVEDWNTITLIQVLPCFNIGWIFDMMRSEKRFNVSFGWLFWIFEWSFVKTGV